MKIEYLIETNNYISIYDFLVDNYYSKPLIKKLSESKNSFSVNDRIVDLSFILLENDFLVVNLPSEAAFQGMVEELPSIIYEDEYLMVVNKPPHLSVIGTRAHYKYNLSLMISFYYQKNNINSGVHLVNRLDKETEGLLIVAKHAYIHHLFSSNVYNIKRRYLAIAEGEFESKQGTINLPIKKDQNHHLRRMVALDGKKAITHYEVIAKNEDFSLLDIELETGRTHQIRVHLSHLGHPLVGDPLYGNEFYDRMFLQSYSLSFIHPITKKEITATIPKENRLSLDSLQLDLVYLPNTNINVYQHKLLYHISSDTVLLGNYLKANESEVVVDVGTNNGALLMYASIYNPILLIGIDINKEALNIARINFKKNNITNYHLINDKAQNVKLDVDVIVSNPPYFSPQPKIKNNSPKFKSKHEDSLSLDELFIFVNNNLKPSGRFYLINRFVRLNEIEELTNKYDLRINDIWIENSTNDKKRIMLTLLKKST